MKPEEEGAERRARDRPRAAEDVDAADDDRGDDLELTPSAAVPLIVPNSMTHMTPATPASRPQSAKPTKTTSRDGMPRMAAASGLLPTA